MPAPQPTAIHPATSKVPEVTIGFWVIKVLATTLGETGADLFTQQYAMGYLAGIVLFALPLVVLVAVQIAVKRFMPLLYWATIIASTTAGTALADYFDRSLGIGYAGGSTILIACVAGSLLAWRLTLGTVAADNVQSAKAESFYWVTITFSQTLGTALGDWTADSGPGYLGGAALFGALLAVVALLWWRTRLARVGLFWAAFILTRPLGATLGDFLDKPVASGGLDLSRAAATAALVAAIGLCLLLIPQRAKAVQSGATG